MKYGKSKSEEKCKQGNYFKLKNQIHTITVWLQSTNTSLYLYQLILTKLHYTE